MPSIVPYKAPSEELSTVPSLEPSNEPFEEPRSVTSSSPSIEPITSSVPSTSNSTSSCYLCSNNISPSVLSCGESCGTLISNDMRVRCGYNGDWKREHYCELSFFLSGCWYPGLHCCDPSEHPIDVVSIYPSLSTPPSFWLSSFPSLSPSTPPLALPWSLIFHLLQAYFLAPISKIFSL